MAKSSSSKAKASLVGKDLDGPVSNAGLTAGSFTHLLERAKFYEDKFRGSNLERELRKAVETFQLFIMPEGRSFAYTRGTGPVSLRDVQLGGYEEEARKEGKFVHGLSVTYHVRVDGSSDDPSEEGDFVISVNLHVPSKFCTFQEVRRNGLREVQPNEYANNTEIVFDYKEKELWAWILVVKKELYSRAIERQKNVVAIAKARIDKLKDLAARIP